MNMLNQGNISSSQKVLIIGASGSVGSFAVQLAKYFGAQVDGICSTRNIDLVKSLGADQVIDYTKEDFTDLDNQYDLIFDAAGKMLSGIRISKAETSLKGGGTFVSVEMDRQDRLEDLDFLTKLLEEEHIFPVIDKTFTLDQIVEAHKYVEGGHKRGNVVVTI